MSTLHYSMSTLYILHSSITHCRGPLPLIPVQCPRRGTRFIAIIMIIVIIKHVLVVVVVVVVVVAVVVVVVGVAVGVAVAVAVGVAVGGTRCVIFHNL